MFLSGHHILFISLHSCNNWSPNRQLSLIPPAPGVLLVHSWQNFSSFKNVQNNLLSKDFNFHVYHTLFESNIYMESNPVLNQGAKQPRKSMIQTYRTRKDQIINFSHFIIALRGGSPPQSYEPGLKSRPWRIDIRKAQHSTAKLRDVESIKEHKVYIKEHQGIQMCPGARTLEALCWKKITLDEVASRRKILIQCYHGAPPDCIYCI